MTHFAVPKTMNAMVLTGHGGLDVYDWREDWPTPTLEREDVLIRVGACGLNNTDVNTRSGWYSKTVTEATTGGSYGKVGAEDPSWGGRPIVFPRIQGADAVGTVVAVGEDKASHLMGKRVMISGWQRDWNTPENKSTVGYFGSEQDGGFAEYTKVDARGLAVINSSLSDAELATFSCSTVTAEGMLTRANVGARDTVLIPGASGGVGTALIQLARRRGARVIAIASEAKHEAMAAMGPEHGPQRLLGRDLQSLGSALKGEKITVVADVVGGPIWPELINCLERGGRYACSGAIAGPIVSFDLRTFYLKDLTLLGSTVTSHETFLNVVRYIENGEIMPTLAASYPLKDLKAAQQAFIDKTHIGNIVVIP